MGSKARVITIILLLIFIVFPSNVFAQDLFSLRVIQGDVKLPEVKLYLDIMDSNDKPIKDIEGLDYNVTTVAGEQEAEVKSLKRFDENNEGVGYIFLIDISSSLKDEEFTKIKNMLTKWVNNMNEKDKAAIITFGEEVKIVNSFTSIKENLNKEILNLDPTDNKTRFYDGVKKATELARIKDSNLPDRRLIVTITDGKDVVAGGVTKAEILKLMDEDPIPVYALGIYSGSLNKDKQNALNILGEFARTSGGSYFQMGELSFEDMYSKILESINNKYVLTVSIPNKKADGKLYHVHVTIKSGSKSIDNGIDIRFNNTMDDIVSPKITQVEVIDNKTIKIYFSEEVNGADLIENYSIINLEDKNINVSKVSYEVLNEENYIATLNFDDKLSGEYTLTPINITDMADKANVIEGTEFNFKVKPTFFEEYKNYIYIGIGLLFILLLIILIFSLIKSKKVKKDVKSEIKSQSISNTSNIPNTVNIPKDNPKFTQPSSNIIKKKIKFAVIDYKNEHSVIEIDISDKLIIGRSEDCDLTFKDEELSRKQCEISYENGNLFIIDLDSTNGTIINGVPIVNRIRLQSGDIIYIGQTELRIIF